MDVANQLLLNHVKSFYISFLLLYIFYFLLFTDFFKPKSYIGHYDLFFFFLFVLVSFNVKHKQMGWSVVHLKIGFQTTYGFINLIIISIVSLYLSFKGFILTYNTAPSLRATLCQTIMIPFFFPLNQIIIKFCF